MEEYKNTETFEVPGRSRDEIFKYLESLKKDRSSDINRNGVEIVTGDYKYFVKASFLFYKMDAEIEIADNLVTIKYNTNIPENFRVKAINELRENINSITKS